MSADYARAAAIHAAAFAGTERGWSAEEIRALAERPGGVMVETAHGFALGQAVADEAELITVAVAPEWRRKGEGRALLAAFETAAAARGARRVALDVAETNAPARALYAAAGFVEDGRRARYYRSADGGRVDAILMSKALDSPR